MPWRELAMAENGRAGQDKVVTIEAIGSSAVQHVQHFMVLFYSCSK